MLVCGVVIGMMETLLLSLGGLHQSSALTSAFTSTRATSFILSSVLATLRDTSKNPTVPKKIEIEMFLLRRPSRTPQNGTGKAILPESNVKVWKKEVTSKFEQFPC